MAHFLATAISLLCDDKQLIKWAIRFFRQTILENWTHLKQYISSQPYCTEDLLNTTLKFFKMPPDTDNKQNPHKMKNSKPPL